MATNLRSSETGTFYVAAVALSVATWQISFTLGAYGEVFYQNIMAVWAASIAALLASVCAGKSEDGETYFSWWGTLLLLCPSALMLAEIFGYSDNTLVINTLQWLLLIAAVPYVGFILLTVALPDTLELRSPRLIAGLAACILSVNLMSFTVGYFNAYFFDCSDFVRAGDEAPPGCWNAQDAAATPS